MPASLEHIHPGTPMGANLIAGGATFRVWAPHAHAVHVIGDFNNRARNDASLLNRDDHGHWRGFIPGVRDRQRYMFYVVGDGSEGPKRDPYARELQTPFPSDCIIRKTDFPWHETGYVTPQFHNFVIYQLHVGTFFTPNLPRKGGTFLDVARKIPHLSGLGITAIQLLPIQEFQTQFSLGYNGTDYFSPEMDFAVEDADLPPYVAHVNALLDAKGLPVSRRGPARRDESAQGADRSLPYPRPRSAPGRGIQPRGRRFRRPEHLLLRPAIDRRVVIGTLSTLQTEVMLAGSCSISVSPKCAIS